MNPKQTKNVAASVRQRLFNRAKERGEDFQYALTRFAAERLLYRLSQSHHAGQFVLKGASLFIVWGGSSHRPTMDVDFLGMKAADPEHLRLIFVEICSVPCEEDGLRFSTESIQTAEIREDKAYGGVRVTLLAYLEQARISIQVDVGFGDAITPDAKMASYPTMLDLPAPELPIYPKETVVAEKCESMVALGMTNSRMRDFYDLRVMMSWFEFSGSLVKEAIRRTFERRRTELPKSVPVALTPTFFEDPLKQTQWKSFLAKGVLTDAKPELQEVIREIAAFLMPPIEALQAKRSFDLTWNPGGPWK